MHQEAEDLNLLEGEATSQEVEEQEEVRANKWLSKVNLRIRVALKSVLRKKSKSAKKSRRKTPTSESRTR